MACETSTAAGKPGSARAAFYCVSSGIYFLGAVGLINSLRLLGHTEPIFVLDYGLTPVQRELLAPHVTLVPGPSDTPPYLLKTIAPLRHPAEVMVLMDADMIVTRPLTRLIQKASEGHIMAVAHGRDRFFPQWGQLLGLRRAQHRRYLSSGLVLLGGGPGKDVIRLMDEAQAKIDIEHTPYSTPNPGYFLVGASFSSRAASKHPFFFADQDVLNAILASEVDLGRIVTLDRRLEAIPPFAGLRVTDETTLRCAHDDGTEPYVVHHYTAKPWLEPTLPGVYTQLLMRLLRRPDVAVRVPKRELPLHLQTGLLASAKRWYLGPFSSRIRAHRDRKGA